VEIAQPRSRLSPDLRAKSPPPGKAPPASLPKGAFQTASTERRQNEVSELLGLLSLLQMLGFGRIPSQVDSGCSEGPSPAEVQIWVFGNRSYHV
jgi:hypothetical protein